MGHLLSKRDIQIDEAKVWPFETRNSRRNASQILSFLGFVTFYAIFIKKTNYATTTESWQKVNAWQCPLGKGTRATKCVLKN